jgi:small-conductance mechanosensitive channel
MTGLPEPPPRRVRITSPRTTAVRRQAARTGAREIDEQTLVGEVYMSSLIHAQLRLALIVIAGAAVVLGGIPLLFVVVPATKTAVVLGVPLPWLILGVLVYPVVYVAARLYVRYAERTEAAFTEFVGRR